MVSNFFPELVLALWLELGVKETKELVRTFWGLPYGRSGVGAVGPVTLVLRFCRQIHGVETHSICFANIMFFSILAKFYHDRHDVHRYVIYFTVFGAPGE